MIQIGWNTGARTVPKAKKGKTPSKPAAYRPDWAGKTTRVLGFAKSFVKNLTDDEKVEHDKELIGAMSLLWALVVGFIPLDIIDPVRTKLREEYPPLGTAHIPPGTLSIVSCFSGSPLMYNYFPRHRVHYCH